MGAANYCTISRQCQETPCHHSSCQLSGTTLAALTNSIAYSACESILAGVCATDVDVDGEPGDWFNTDDVAEFAGEDVDQVLTYLDARGLLIRHPKQPNWIQIQDESEATR